MKISILQSLKIIAGWNKFFDNCKELVILFYIIDLLESGNYWGFHSSIGHLSISAHVRMHPIIIQGKKNILTNQNECIGSFQQDLDNLVAKKYGGR